MILVGNQVRELEPELSTSAIWHTLQNAIEVDGSVG
jgi:hypothetical protein